MAELIRLPVFSIKDVPDDTTTVEHVNFIPCRNEYYSADQLKGYGIRSFYNRESRKDIPGLSVMRRGRDEFINVKMDVDKLATLLLENGVIEKVGSI
jgi:hypothetical protein